MKKKQQLDNLDFEILRELQIDCRTPLQEIAEKVGAPTSTVHYRVKRLERDGVLRSFRSEQNMDLDTMSVSERNWRKSLGFGRYTLLLERLTSFS